MILTIGLRELKSLFLSPLAWVILATLQIIFALVFTGGVLTYLANPDPAGVTVAIVTPLFAWASVLLLFVIPLLTMRLISEERRNKTLVLLLTAPVTMTEIILGKYLGVLLFLLVVILLIVAMVLSLSFGTTLDFGLLGAQIVGLILLLASFASVGLYMSTRSESPAVAAILTFGMLIFLWLTEFLRSFVNPELLSYLSVINHYTSLLEGKFDTADVMYYLLFTTLFVVLSIRHLDTKRLGL